MTRETERSGVLRSGRIAAENALVIVDRALRTRVRPGPLAVLALVLNTLACSSAEESTPTPDVLVSTDLGQDSASSEPDTGPVLPAVVPLVDQGPAPTHDGDWEWLAWDDDTSVGSIALAASDVVEYVRFEVFEPVRIRSVRVMVDVPATGPLDIVILDDFGGDGISIDVGRMLRLLTRSVTPVDSGVWLDLPVDPPLVLDPGRIFYIGTVWPGPGGPKLRFDAAPTAVPEGVSVHSLVWRPETVDPTTGAKTVFATAPGDYLVRVEVQRFGLVDSKDTLFEAVGPEAIPAFSRAAFADVDDDGDLDLMTDGRRLLSNRGDGTFEDVSATALPAELSWGGGVFGDIDDDGDEDWFGTGDVDVLLRNDGGTFVDITAGSGIDDSQQHTCNGVSGVRHVPTESAAFVDIDGDGLLDLYQGNFICWDDGIPSKDKLFRNLGGGTFEDISAISGIDAGQGDGWAARGVAPSDYDNDGDMDILVTNYRLHPNLHWRNNGDSTFTNVALEDGLEGKRTYQGGYVYGHSIGAAWGDFDWNGTLDVFIARLAHPRFISFSDTQRLYLNSGGDAPTFTDITDLMGIRYQETPSNPNAWDVDNDGDLDLFWTCIYAGRRSQLYLNDWPTGGWREQSHPSGLVVTDGWGSVTGDVDNDGDLDLLSKQSFRNRNRYGGYALQVRPRGQGAGGHNKSGIGARVTLQLATGSRLATRPRMQEFAGTHGTSAGDSPWLHFGLGRETSARVTVTFPASGKVIDVGTLAAGRYTVHEDGTVVDDGR